MHEFWLNIRNIDLFKEIYHLKFNNDSFFNNTQDYPTPYFK